MSGKGAPSISMAAARARRHFDEEAAHYDQVGARRDPSYGRVLRAMLWLLDIPPDAHARILELGVGTGNQTRLLLRQFPRATVTGYDVSPAMLGRARRKLASFRDRVELLLADFSSEIEGGPYDAVVSASAIHHVAQRRLGPLFERVFALLRPGGQLVIAEPFRPRDAALADLYWNARQRALAASGIEGRDYDRHIAQRAHRGPGHRVSVEQYLRALRRAGFVEVDYPWRELSRAIVHGRRPRG